MVDTCHHTEERSATHYDVEVSDHEIRVVQLNINGRISQEDTGNSSRKEERHKTDREKHRRGEPKISFPHGCDVVKNLHRRRHRDDQR